jgi:hypothetical protein
MPENVKRTEIFASLPVSHGGLRLPAEVGRVTPCAPLVAQSCFGAHGATRLSASTEAVHCQVRGINCSEVRPSSGAAT